MTPFCRSFKKADRVRVVLAESDLRRGAEREEDGRYHIRGVIGPDEYHVEHPPPARLCKPRQSLPNMVAPNS